MLGREGQGEAGNGNGNGSVGGGGQGVWLSPREYEFERTELPTTPGWVPKLTPTSLEQKKGLGARFETFFVSFRALEIDMNSECVAGRFLRRLQEGSELQKYCWV